MENTNAYFRVYANCVPVKGARRSTICDLHRHNLFFIPNDLYDILIDHRDMTFQELSEYFGEESRETLDAYFKYLMDNELGFWTDEPERFPDINFEYDAPAIITNSIIDADANSDHDWKAIFEQLEELGCQDLQIRFYDVVHREELERIMELLERRAIKSVDVIIRYHPSYRKKYLMKLTERFFRIKTMTLHTAPRDEVYRMLGGKDRNGMGNIIFVTQKIDSNTHCGAISPMYFTFSNMRLFSEAKNFNSCLNRKVGIDVDGAIKNCPSLPKSYGNIKDTSIHSAVTNIHFQELWQVNKDQIDICKTCEFRYVCTDCRAFIDDSEDKYSKPSKCSYNPYTTKWEA